jgi:hypothetical protein
LIQFVINLSHEAICSDRSLFLRAQKAIIFYIFDGIL